MTDGSLVVRPSDDRRTRDDVALRTVEGKTTPEVVRCLALSAGRALQQGPSAPGAGTCRCRTGIVLREWPGARPGRTSRLRGTRAKLS